MAGLLRGRSQPQPDLQPNAQPDAGGVTPLSEPLLSTEQKEPPETESLETEPPEVEPSRTEASRTEALEIVAPTTLQDSPATATATRQDPDAVPSQPVTVASPNPNRITLVPDDSGKAAAHWQVSEAEKAALRQRGGEKLALRVYDVTQPQPHLPAPHLPAQPDLLSFQQYDCDEEAQDFQVPITLGDRDYVAEIGYVCADDRWLSLAKSDAVRISTASHAANSSSASPSPWLGTAVKPVPELLARHASKPSFRANADPEDSPTAARSGGLSHRPAPENRLILVPRSAEEVYAYWEVSEAQKEALRQRDGQRLVLRVYDITGIDSKNNQPPKGVQQFECDETANDRLVSVPAHGDYIATLGYLTSEGLWLPAARSAPIRIRATDTPPIWKAPPEHS
ncbi:MAG: DUF4912 domain-containing protein [Leptolyngbyaceae cyanobacterium CRU_2_3]|nr:DUF4912 domain-containing protein [Leptolyngbyaceae cyanobacterium CRU_2_3]